MRTLADREDFVLQRVGIVADHTELDVDGHSVLTCLGMLLPKSKNGRSVLPFCGSSLDWYLFTDRNRPESS
jgi:hypothetical protein